MATTATPTGSTTRNSKQITVTTAATPPEPRPSLSLVLLELDCPDG